MMKRIFFITIFTILASGCSGQQQKPDEPQAMPCVIQPDQQKPRICTMQYDPVCGCNGKTYGNACTAKGAGVQRFEPGACKQADETPD